MFARKRMRDVLDEIARMMDDIESDLEEDLTQALESGRRIFNKPIVYGFSMNVGPDGLPSIRPFGNVGQLDEGVRQPAHDQVFDEMAGELKALFEIPGADRETIDVKALEDRIQLTAGSEQRRYAADLPLRAKVVPESAQATYKDGILEIRLKLKGKANKDFHRVSVE
jgi:HSP20 family protein